MTQEAFERRNKTFSKFAPLTLLLDIAGFLFKDKHTKRSTILSPVPTDEFLARFKAETGQVISPATLHAFGLDSQDVLWITVYDRQMSGFMALGFPENISGSADSKEDAVSTVSALYSERAAGTSLKDVRVSGVVDGKIRSACYRLDGNGSYGLLACDIGVSGGEFVAHAKAKNLSRIAIPVNVNRLLTGYITESMKRTTGQIACIHIANPRRIDGMEGELITAKQHGIEKKRQYGYDFGFRWDSTPDDLTLSFDPRNADRQITEISRFAPKWSVSVPLKL